MSSKQQTKYVVRYRYSVPGSSRRTWDFNTKDKAQAYRKARKYAEHGLLIGLYRDKAGQWSELPVTAEAGAS